MGNTLVGVCSFKEDGNLSRMFVSLPTAFIYEVFFPN